MTAVSTAPTDRADAAPLTGVRRRVDVTYAALSALFVLGVLAQVYLAGAGAFSHAAHGRFDLHEELGNVLGVVAAVLFVLSLIARPSRNLVIGAFVLALLTEVAQHGLAAVGKHNHWVGGVHAFDGMLILLLACTLAILSYRRVRGR